MSYSYKEGNKPIVKLKDIVAYCEENNISLDAKIVFEDQEGNLKNEFLNIIYDEEKDLLVLN